VVSCPDARKKKKQIQVTYFEAVRRVQALPTNMPATELEEVPRLLGLDSHCTWELTGHIASCA